MKEVEIDMVGYQAKTIWIGFKEGTLLNVYRRIVEAQDAIIYLGVSPESITSIGVARDGYNSDLLSDGYVLYNPGRMNLSIEMYVIYITDSDERYVYGDMGALKRKIGKVENKEITWYDII